MSLLRRLFTAENGFRLAALLLALPLLLPHLTPAVPPYSDADIHLHRMVSAGVNLHTGGGWPRWSYELHQGYGYPSLNFYAPGVYLAGGAAWLLTGVPAIWAFKAILAGALCLYPLGAYTFARTFSGRAAALAGAAVYTYIPYRSYELWVQVNLPQWVALALMAPVLWALVHAAQGRRGGVVIAGLLFAALILAHQVTAFVFTPLAGLYALALAMGARRGRYTAALLRTGGGLLLGLLLAAIYWLPALIELPYTRIDDIQDVTFEVAQNFIPLEQILSGSTPIDRARLNWADRFSTMGPRLGWLAAALATAGTALVFWRRVPARLRAHAAGGTLILAACLFLITQASAPVWDALPLAGYIQFPWRLIGPAALAGLPGAAALVAVTPVRWRAPMAAAVIAAALGAVLPLFYAPLETEPRLEVSPADAIAYEQRTGNIGLTASNEYLPRTARTRPDSPPDPALLADIDALAWRIPIDASTDLPADASVTTGPGAGQSMRYQIETEAPFRLVLRQMAFPGWQAAIDGQPVAIEPHGPHGLISVTVPAGSHTVTVRYTGTPIQHAAAAISLLALVGVGAVAFGLLRRVRPAAARPGADADPDDASETRATRWLPAAVASGMIGFTLVQHLVLLPHTDLFRPASDPLAPPASRRVDVTFGDTLHLLGYDLTPAQAAPGEPVTVRLYWRVTAPTDRTLTAAVQITGPDGRGVWGGADAYHPGAIPTTRWVPDRYVVDRYTFTIAPDAPPFVGELRVFASERQGEQITELTTADGATSALLTSFRITGDYRRIAADELTGPAVRYGDGVRLRGYALHTGDAQTCVTLRWEALAADRPAYTVLLHLRDAAGETIAVLDGPPLDGLYPTDHWQTGQTLDDRHCFPVPGGAAELLIGLYTQPDLTRAAAVTADGSRLPDDVLRVPLNP